MSSRQEFGPLIPNLHRVVTIAEHLCDEGVFETLRTKGGGFFGSAVNSKTKETRTMKLCTVTVYYIVDITK